jgi:glucan 1,3-beta-glucosidase
MKTVLLISFVVISYVNAVSLKIVNENISDKARHIAQAIRDNAVQMRGVNLGSWLVVEHWMSSDSPLWRGVPDNIANQGEYKLMEYLGHSEGDKRMEEHRSQWITEGDIAEIKKFGLNAVRVPIGYWITGFDRHDPSGQEHWKMFAPGSLKYLDILIRNWAPKYNIAVLVDLHAAKGSQNGNDHSAPDTPGKSFWSQHPENVENALDVIDFIADRYKNETSFLAIGMLNEPGGTTNEQVLRNFYLTSYDRVRRITNVTITHAPLLWQQEDGQWENFTPPPRYQGCLHEWHKYTVWGFEGKSEDEILNYVRHNLKNSIRNWKGNWMYIGEWSFATPPSAPFNDRNRFLEFASAYVDALNQAPAGWTYWTWKTSYDGGGKHVWSMRNLLRNGLFPKW